MMKSGIWRKLTLSMLCVLAGCGPKVGEIAGLVVDRYTSERIAGARIVLEETGNETVTDENGEYHFLKVVPGTYTVVASKENYSVPDAVLVTAKAGALASALEIEMACADPACAEIYGNRIQATVRDRYTGDPLEGVLVQLRSSVRETSGATRADGSVLFEALLPGEKCTLAFSRENYTSEKADVRLKDAMRQTVPVNVEIFCISPECASAYGNALTGIVTDGHMKKPLEGVRVTIKSRLGPVTDTTRSDGTYVFRNLLPHQQYEVSFALENYSSDSESFDFMDRIHEEKRIDSELECLSTGCAERYGLTAGGRVTDYRTGRPMAGATVMVEVQHQVTSTGETLSARCDESGTFKIFHLLPNDQVTIRLKEPGREEPAAWYRTFSVPDRTDYHFDLGSFDLLYGDRFFASDDGTVLDTETGYLWVRDPAACGGEFGTPGKPSPLNRTKAEQVCEGLAYAGYTDWRLPTFGEMAGLYEGLGELTKERDRRVEPFVWGGEKNSRYWVSNRTSNAVRYFDFAVGPGDAGWTAEEERSLVIELPFVRPVRSTVDD